MPAVCCEVDFRVSDVVDSACCAAGADAATSDYNVSLGDVDHSDHISVTSDLEPPPLEEFPGSASEHSMTELALQGSSELQAGPAPEVQGAAPDPAAPWQHLPAEERQQMPPLNSWTVMLLVTALPLSTHFKPVRLVLLTATQRAQQLLYALWEV